ncbi:hypothetical protein AB6D96_17430, partial [Vibrio cyclitrophicus]
MIVQNSTLGVESQLEYIINKGLNRLVCTNKNRNKNQYLKSKSKSQKTKTSSRVRRYRLIPLTEPYV